MRTVLERQSNLSLATAAFTAVGALLSVLASTVFRLGAAPRPDVLLVAVVCVALSASILARGSRFSRRTATALVAGAFAVLFWYAWATPEVLRALNSGLLFYPLFIFLVWFGRIGHARAIAYAWLAAYVLVVGARFGEDVLPLLVTLVVTGAALGELIHRFKRELENATITDPLCQVWNQRGFERLLGKAIETARRSDRPLSALYLDLDDFKSINDGRGHAAGDRVLQQFSREMEDAIRPQDSFARLGGDEFALLLPDTDGAGALRLGAELQGRVTAAPWSFGLAEWASGESAGAFIARADALLLREKRTRKGVG